MPLAVEILRDGEPLKVWDHPNSFQYVSYMYTAAIKEQAPDTGLEGGKRSNFGELENGEWIDFSWQPIYYLDIECDLVRKGRQTLQSFHNFPDLILEPGDELHAWRESK